MGEKFFKSGFPGKELGFLQEFDGAPWRDAGSTLPPDIQEIQQRLSGISDAEKQVARDLASAARKSNQAAHLGRYPLLFINEKGEIISY